MKISPAIRFSGLLLSLVGLLFAENALHAETIWWEAEAAKDTNMPVKAGDPTLISGGQWLDGEVKEGLYADYNVNVAQGGHFTFLARRLWLHGAFRWRFDDGAWVNVEGLNQDIVDQVTTKEGPACWIDLGYVTLKPGPHTLRIELVTQTTYQFNHLFAFDCFVLSNEGFAPLGINPAGGPHRPEIKINEADFGKFLPRTMALLESSGPDHHTPLHILFYGQSIIANSAIDQEILKYLHGKYPYADIKIKKVAIGGYEAPRLRKTAWQDLYPENPDLLVFHDYGGENGELEEIYRGIRSNLTTEVLTWTHHVDNFGSGIDKQRDASSIILRSLAAKYGFELADVRVLWKDYLKETHLPRTDFLIDKMIHLNPKGTDLLASFLLPHFRVNPDASTDWKKHITTIPLSASAKEVTFDPGAWTTSSQGVVSSGTAPLKIELFGNRVDLTGVSGTGSAKILLDGQTPSTEPDTLAASRSDKAPGSWWPAISLVQLGKNTIVEKYTLNFHGVKPDGSSYAFTVQGSVSGDEGAGTSGVDFVSKSGRISIKAEDIALSTVKKTLKKDLPAQFTINFEVHSMSEDLWKSPGALPPGTVSQRTVIRCWTDGPHTLEIIPNNDGPVGFSELTIFSPLGRG